MRLALAVTAAASMIGATPALAGTFTVDHADGSASYQALPGEANDVGLVLSATKMKLQDKGVPAVGFVELGATRCVLNELYKYDCPIGAIKSFEVDLGDARDRYEDVGTAVPTVVHAGSGRTEVTTGAGSDHVLVRNGGSDRVDCGAGVDYVMTDPSGTDEIATDCEHVDAGQTGVLPPPGDPGVNTGTGDDASAGHDGSYDGQDQGEAHGGETPERTTFETPLGLTVPLGIVELLRPTTAIVPLACAATVSDGCRGEVVVDIALPRRSRRRPKHRVVAARGRYIAAQRRRRRIGRRTFKLDAGESVKLPVTLVLRGHHSLVSRRRRKARGVLKVVQRDRAGKVVGVHTQAVTLRLEKRKWSRRVRRHR